MRRLILLSCLCLCPLLALSQQDQEPTLPLSEEAENLFAQAIVLSEFASQNCENVSANTPMIQSAILAIRDEQYRIEEYNVALFTSDVLLHKFYVRTFDPPALVEFQVLSRNGMCDQFSFNLIVEETDEP